MEKIAYTHINVNNLSLQELTKIFYDGLLTRATDHKEVRDYYVIDEYQIYIPNLGLGLAHKDCGFEVPEPLQLAGKRAKRRARADKKERFKVIYKHKKDKIISDALLLVMEAIQLATARYISIEREIGKFISYKGTVKGSDAYNYKLMQKCREDAKKMQEGANYFYFLTITYSPNLLSEDRELAFKHFNDAKGKLIKQIKRSFHVNIQCFTEVTNLGYPHAHMIIYSEKPLCSEKKKVTTPQKIKRGKLFDFIQKNVDCPIFDLKKAVPGKLANYLVKYMAKSTKKTDDGKAVKDIKLSKNQRKELMTRYFPCVFNYKSYVTTWTKKKNAKKENKFVNFINYFNQKFGHEMPALEKLQGMDKILEAARRAALLINFRIKENVNCAGRAFFLKRIPFTPLSKRSLGQQEAKFVPAALAGEAIAVPLGCRGCKFRNLLRENYQNPDFLQKLMTTRPFYTAREAIEIILPHKNHLETAERHKGEERAAKMWPHVSEKTMHFVKLNMAEADYFEAIAEKREKEFLQELKDIIREERKRNRRRK